MSGTYVHAEPLAKKEPLKSGFFIPVLHYYYNSSVRSGTG